ncbi:bacteriocin-like protein [Chryseobacterium scophthalmum]|uniref:Uncharacterized protein n=1 Tax=Chryseobacterium scophthalmum TaxID=59733 RepID=A0A1N6G2T1_9FLAO|nr:hypothetical protein SAMN05421769_1815 [Chryseobacterium scophthalmum]
MKKSNLKKLSRAAQKSISGGVGGLEPIQCATGCYKNYLGDGQGILCIVPPCQSPNFGTQSQDANGRWQCCY